MLATANTEEIGRGFGKNAAEWTGREEIISEINGSTVFFQNWQTDVQ